MAKFSLEFECRVINVLNDGFNAVEGGYLIKFRDKKKHFFSLNDNLRIKIETAENEGIDEIRAEYSIIHAVLNNYTSNGFTFREANKKSLWLNIRGMLSYKLFENNSPFENDALLRIIIQKV